MNSEIKKVLNKIEKNGFEAYIVGGFVRDYLLCRSSNDVDICTNALPKDIQNIFGISRENVYGSYNLKTNRFNFDITTYRQEEYLNGRNPKVTYTTNLLSDLNRRDFTMNAICMNGKGKIINLLHGVEDLEDKKVVMIGDPNIRLKEDPLRILRAVRFSCTLDLKLDEVLWQSMQENVLLLENMSNYHIKKEIDSILLSPNFQKGLTMLQELGISYFYPNEKRITYVNDVNGMWAQLKPKRDFLFSKVERKEIEKIREVIEIQEITMQTIYQYGLYPVMVAAKIKQIPENYITKMYEELPIHEQKDLNISFEEIRKITKKTPKECKKIQEHLINRILEGKMPNQKENIQRYLREGE